MSVKIDSVMRLLASAIAYRQWARTTVEKWAAAWNVDPVALRDVIWMLIKETDRRVGDAK